MKSGQIAIKRSAQEIAALKTAWHSSGKSKSEFSRENGVNYMTFIGWFAGEKKKLKKAVPQSMFIPVEIASKTPQLFAEIVLKNGTRVCFHERVGVEYFRLLLR